MAFELVPWCPAMTEPTTPDPSLPADDPDWTRDIDGGETQDRTLPIPHLDLPRAPGRIASPRIAPAWEPVPGYRVERRLGRGGFGEVWSATGPGGVVLAMKFIRLDDGLGDAEVRALDFMKNVHHPHLNGISGVWRTDDLLIIAMELADGTLGDACREADDRGDGGIAPELLLEYFREAAKGIDHLNGLGIIHRDIKPHNILIMSGGVKVADFGLARLASNPGHSSRLSMTPSYAAPELCNGEAGPGTDQYALAVTYCELRGGQMPFPGNHWQVITGHLHNAPDLTMLPEPERPVVARALSKSPGDRFPDCRTFIGALAAAVPGPAAPPTWVADPPRVESSRRGFLLAIGSVGSLATAAGATAAWVGLARHDIHEDIRREEILATLRFMRRHPSAPIRSFAPGVEQVDQIESNSNPAFVIYQDDRIVDLRSWRQVPPNRLNVLTSAVTQTRHLWMRKIRAADTLHFLARTTGAEVFFRCPSHPFHEVKQAAPVMFGNERMIVREVVIDVAALDVDEDFALVIVSTYWNSMQTPPELWFGVIGSGTASKISQLILFPDGKPFRTYRFRTVDLDAGEPRDYKGPRSVLTGPDWVNWDIPDPANGVTYRTDWTW